MLNSRTATDVAAGLGFCTIHPARRWLLEWGKEIGMTSPRVQIAWASTGPGAGIESVDKELTLPPAWRTWLDWCAELDLEPTVVAAYGPPHHAVGTLTLAVPARPRRHRRVLHALDGPTAAATHRR